MKMLMILLIVYAASSKWTKLSAPFLFVIRKQIQFIAWWVWTSVSVWIIKWHFSTINAFGIFDGVDDNRIKIAAQMLMIMKRW